jgi:hypothetical protein
MNEAREGSVEVQEMTSRTGKLSASTLGPEGPPGSAPKLMILSRPM